MSLDGVYAYNIGDWADDITDTEPLKTMFKYWQHLVYIVLLFVVFPLTVKCFGFWATIFTPDKLDLKHQLIEEDNKAVAVTLSGFVLALGLVISGVLSDQDPEETASIGFTFVWIVIGTVLLLVSNVINDKLCIFKIKNKIEIVDKHNVAVAFVEMGSWTASGLTVMGSMYGNDSNFGEALASTLIFFVFCQIAFIIMIFLYELITPFKFQTELTEKENVAVGVDAGLHMVAIAICVTSPLIKTESIPAFWIWYVVGLVIFFFVRLLVDILTIPEAKIHNELVKGNCGAAVIQGVMLISVGNIISTFIVGQCGTVTTVSWGDRLTATRIIWDMFTWVNLMLFAMGVVILFFTKIPFAIAVHIRTSGLRLTRGAVRKSMSTFLSITETGQMEMVSIDGTAKLAQQSQQAQQAQAKENEGTEATNPSEVGMRVLPDGEAQASGSEAASAPQAGPSSSTQKIETRPPGLSLAYSGYLMGTGLVMRGAFGAAQGSSNNKLAVAFVAVCWAGIGGSILMLSYWFNNRILWFRRPGYDVITNTAAAIVEGMGYISSAVLILALLDSNSEPGPWNWDFDFLTFGLYWLISQVLLILLGAGFHKMTRYNDVEQIRGGNTAAAVNFALHVLSLSIIMSSPLNKTISIWTYLVFIAITIVILHAYRLIWRAILGLRMDTEIRADKNWGCALVEGCGLVSLALGLSQLLRSNACQVGDLVGELAKALNQTG